MLESQSFVTARFKHPYPLFIQHKCVYLRRRTFARGNKRRRLLPRGHLESLLRTKPTQHGSFRSIFSAALAAATMLRAAPYPLVGTTLCLVSYSTQICPWCGLRYRRLSLSHSLTVSLLWLLSLPLGAGGKKN
jgi:hypothetical protein